LVEQTVTNIRLGWK